MILKPGYYEVKDYYYWQGGWEEEGMSVKTNKLVKIERDKQTILKIAIPKDRSGYVTRDELFFKISQKEL